jgi:solute carrier family 25 S-adenosylmethionine transporter 26
MLLIDVTLIHPSTLIATSSDVNLQATVVAGALSKLARDSVLHPLDTLKTRSQILSDLQREAAQQGSLYAGVLPTLLLSLPAGSAYFGLNEVCKDLGGSAEFAAALSATGYWFVRTPSELLKTRAMTETDDLQPFLQGDVRRFSSLLCNEGVGALWTGFGATVLRSIPFEVLRLSCYPILLEAFSATAANDSGVSGALAGFTASSGAALLTQPLDTIKTSLQLTREASEWDESAATSSQVDRFASAVTTILANGGPAALYRGGLYRAAIAGLGGGITFGTYQIALPWVEHVLHGFGGPS